MSRRLLPLIACGVIGLGGCISILPKTKPVQLYSFADAPGEARPQPATVGADAVSLIFPPVRLPRAAAGDQLLAQTGPEAAYIAGARWVSPAAVLFSEAVQSAFAARSTGARLLSRQEIAGAQGFLRLEVADFAARYAAPGAIPTVRVALTATLARRTGIFAAEKTFVAEAPATENGARAIVDAYNRAVEQVTTELVAWTDGAASVVTQDDGSVGGGATGRPAGAPALGTPAFPYRR